MPQKVWIVDNFLQQNVDAPLGVAPMPQILDHLVAEPDRLADVRTSINEAGQVLSSLSLSMTACVLLPE